MRFQQIWVMFVTPTLFSCSLDMSGHDKCNDISDCRQGYICTPENRCVKQEGDTDLDSNTAPDESSGSENNTGIDTDSVTDSVTDMDTGTVIDITGDTNTDRDNDTDSVIDADIGSNSNSDSNADSGNDSNTPSDITSDTITDNGTDIDIDINADVNTDVDTETNTVSDTEIRSDSDSVTESEGSVEAPLISDIDGDGSPRPIVDADGLLGGIGNAVRASNRFRTMWRISGTNLDTVTNISLVQIAGENLVFNEADGLNFEDGGSAMQRNLLLPLTLAAGLYTLTLSNDGGSAEAKVYVLQGEKGDGLDCDDTSCTVVGNKDLVVNGNGTFSGEVSADSGRFSDLTSDAVTVNTTIWMPECPSGYSRDTTVDAYILCQKDLGGGRIDEMVKVADYWVDKYELSVWETSTCTGAQYGASMNNWTMNKNGTGAEYSYGCSLSGVMPSRYMSWFQALRSCERAGKSLCSNAQWQVAALGTPDVDTINPGPGNADCNIWNGVLPNGASWADQSIYVTLTGSAGNCVSNFGASDMIGNLFEFVSDWMTGGFSWQSTNEVGQYPWEPDFNEDATWNMNATSRDETGYVQGLPSVVLRGGSYETGKAAGSYAVSLTYGPSNRSPSVGARCCKHQ